MAGSIMIYIGCVLLIGWGSAHLVNTGAVVRGFEPISLENRRVITMEWVLEGASLIFFGILVGAVAAVGRGSVVGQVVLWLTFGALNAFSLISLLTGFRNAFIAYKLCPVIFSGSSLLIIVGNYLD